METKNNSVVVGMIKGRHELPVEDYIFNEAIEDVHAYESIRKNICKFVESKIHVKKNMGVAMNSADYSDYLVFKGEKSLIVYVTGLTAVTAELIGVCARNGVSLTLMNYDASTGEYKPQVIFA